MFLLTMLLAFFEDLFFGHQMTIFIVKNVIQYALQ